MWTKLGPSYLGSNVLNLLKNMCFFPLLAFRNYVGIVELDNHLRYLKRCTGLHGMNSRQEAKGCESAIGVRNHRKYKTIVLVSMKMQVHKTKLGEHRYYKVLSKLRQETNKYIHVEGYKDKRT